MVYSVDMPIDMFRRNVRHVVTVKSIAKYLGLDIRTVKKRAREIGVKQITFLRPGASKPVYRHLEERTVRNILESFRQKPAGPNKRKPRPAVPVPDPSEL
jgi:hypothetical protein